MYVFGKRPVDIQKCADTFGELYADTESHVVVLYDVTYSHAIGTQIGLYQSSYCYSVQLLTAFMEWPEYICFLVYKVMMQGHTSGKLKSQSPGYL